MNWHRVETNWKQLIEKSVFHWERLRPDHRNGVDLLGSDASREGQSTGNQATVLRPDDHVRRSEFSLHIGC
jgi:hypothetical protein